LAVNQLPILKEKKVQTFLHLIAMILRLIICLSKHTAEYSGVDRKMSWGVQYNIFALKALLIISFLNKIHKTPFYLVHSSFGLGVQMPLCTTPGYATGRVAIVRTI